MAEVVLCFFLGARQAPDTRLSEAGNGTACKRRPIMALFGPQRWLRVTLRLRTVEQSHA